MKVSATYVTYSVQNLQKNSKDSNRRFAHLDPSGVPLLYVYFCNMRILPDPLAFQWDEGNVDKNVQKYGVTIQESEELFASIPFVTFEDVMHSTTSEKRYKGLGKTKSGRKLFVAFTIRDRKVRVISIRAMKRKERQAYEKFEADSTI